MTAGAETDGVDKVQPDAQPQLQSSRQSRPRRNLKESPLAWLHARRGPDGRRLIGDAQLEAGEQFQSDFHQALLQPRLTASWSPTPPDGRRRRGVPGFGVEMADGVAAAKQRVTQALRAVGPELAGLIVDVCGLQNGLELAERRMGLPQRSGKVVLQIALTILARHYGILKPPAGGGPAGQHWGSADFKPTLDAWRTDGAGRGGRPEEGA